MKQREYYLDNAKALLMFTVVGAHYISIGPRNYYEFFDWLHYYVAIFNLPVFFAISGYLSSRSRKNYEGAFKNLLVPYIMMCFVMYFYLLLLNGKAKLLIFQAPFAMWFLLALFFYRVISPIMEKMRCPILFAVLLGLGAATIEQLDTGLFSVERVMGFFPFYVWGYFGLKPIITKLRELDKKYRYMIGGLCYALLAVVVLYLKMNVSREAYLYRHSYINMGMSDLEGIVWRLVGYACGVIGTLGLLVIVSNREKWYTYIGQNSITVYLGHVLLYFIFKKYGCFDSASWYIVVLDMVAIFITTVCLAFPVFDKAYTKCVQMMNAIIFKKESID